MFKCTTYTGLSSHICAMSRCTTYRIISHICAMSKCATYRYLLIYLCHVQGSWKLFRKPAMTCTPEKKDQRQRWNGTEILIRLLDKYLELVFSQKQTNFIFIYLFNNTAYKGWKYCLTYFSWPSKNIFIFWPSLFKVIRDIQNNPHCCISVVDSLKITGDSEQWTRSCSPMQV